MTNIDQNKIQKFDFTRIYRQTIFILLYLFPLFIIKNSNKCLKIYLHAVGCSQALTLASLLSIILLAFYSFVLIFLLKIGFYGYIICLYCHLIIQLIFYLIIYSQNTSRDPNSTISQPEDLVLVENSDHNSNNNNILDSLTESCQSRSQYRFKTHHYIYDCVREGLI